MSAACDMLDTLEIVLLVLAFENASGKQVREKYQPTVIINPNVSRNDFT